MVVMYVLGGILFISLISLANTHLHGIETNSTLAVACGKGKFKCKSFRDVLMNNALMGAFLGLVLYQF